MVSAEEWRKQLIKRWLGEISVESEDVFWASRKFNRTEFKPPKTILQKLIREEKFKKQRVR